MLPASVRIFVCTVPQDMRRSFDTLALVVRQVMGENPESGALYVFVGKRPTRIKVLWFDKNGYCLLCKRLHRALFLMPTADVDGAPLVRIDSAVLGQLLQGVAHEKRRRLDA